MKTIITELKRIRSANIFDLNPHTGICGNIVSDVYAEWYINRDAFFKLWIRYSGDISYPIPITDGDAYDTSEDQYYGSEIWAGEQLEMRHSLLEHMIKCFKDFES